MTASSEIACKPRTTTLCHSHANEHRSKDTEELQPCKPAVGESHRHSVEPKKSNTHGFKIQAEINCGVGLKDARLAGKSKEVVVIKVRSSGGTGGTVISRACGKLWKC